MNDHIRNFCIIAHIDHGKSTLADRFLEVTQTVNERKMRDQLLDQMELEQERGITIKLQPVRMTYKDTVMNLIDTPGHVDFTYEVSRSLAAVEGAILLVDATQGVQAQTIANLYLALDQDLTIIPVLNKIDLPNADVDTRAEEIIHLIGCKREDILTCSGKTGEGVPELLDAVIKRVAPPEDLSDKPCRAMIFDSFYDDYRGVVASVRVAEGSLHKGDKLTFMRTKGTADALEIGHYTPALAADQTLGNGQVGYIVTGLKELGDVRVGDTVTNTKAPAAEPLDGYKEVKSMVYAGIFPKEGDQYEQLRGAMDKLKLSDSSLSYEPEHSQALGFGFRCGFLGMLHLDIFQERLRREFDIDIMATVPSVAYQVTKTNGEELVVKSPQDLPDAQVVAEVREPWMNVDIIVPEAFIGNVMGLVADRKGRYLNTEYLTNSGTDKRALLHYEMPLASLITDFYDKLKSVTSGYASLNYDIKQYETTNVVKLDILVAEDILEELASLVWRDDAHKVGKQIVAALKETLPRQQFVLKIQAAVGGKVVAGDRLSAMRKDVTAKLYGGDVTRKRKLLEKQKKGKKKMQEMGRGKVDIPPDAYMAVLKR